jgi:molybdopterin-guanine dinucleotide biosynthesis protein A
MGTDKATLRIRGAPILQHLLMQLRWTGPTLLVRAPGKQSPLGAQLFEKEVVDAVEGQGPMRGILTAIDNAKGDVVVITVDMPAITPDILHELTATAVARPELGGIMFEVACGNERRVEPFPSIYRQTARDVLIEALRHNRRSVRRLLDNPQFATVPAPHGSPESVWLNLNTPEDFAAFENSIDGQDKI